MYIYIYIYIYSSNYSYYSIAIIDTIAIIVIIIIVTRRPGRQAPDLGRVHVRAAADCGRAGPSVSRRGVDGVSTNGVTANSLFFDRGAFWVLPITYFYLPRRARAYLFPQAVKHHFAAAHEC